ncbi:MAG: hypothetical protein A2046_14525 [Bacteroidetes bacterium GWA2_30_7]|nr:MAG: hypothetical protein A2046_14525 [Bacteroidetes bacterium GWA2_30_7]
MSAISFSQNLQLDWVLQGKGLNYSNAVYCNVTSSRYTYLTGFFKDSLKMDDTLFVSRGSYDIYLSKIDSLGKIKWLRQIGGTGNDNSRSVIVDNNENIYVSGSFWFTAQFEDSTIVSSGMNFFLAKYDSSGNFIWVRSLSSSINAISNQYLACDKNNNIYSIGYFSGTINSGEFIITAKAIDIFIVKYSNNGILKWIIKRGGNLDDYSQTINIDSENNIYISGFFSDTATFGTNVLISHGLTDIFIEKLDTLSTSVWLKQIGGKYIDSGAKIAFDSNNNAYSCGYFQDTVIIDSYNLVSKGDKDAFLYKFDKDGNPIWAKSFGSSGTEAFGGISINENDIIYVFGKQIGFSVFDSDTLISTYSFPILLRMDTAAQINWIYSFQGTTSNSNFFSIKSMFNNIYISGYFDASMNCIDTNIISTGDMDFYLMKLSDIFYSPNQGSPLPINLTSYKIICTSTGSLITWATASETNNDYFTVEKTNDLKEWKLVATIYSSFDSHEIKNYKVDDNKMVSDQLTFYRLKQTDKDAKFKFYDVLSILCHLPNDILEIIGVNASDNAVNIIIKTEGIDSVIIKLHDMNSKLISQEKISPIKGANTVSLVANNISSGTYLVTVIQNDIRKSKKIILN